MMTASLKGTGILLLQVLLMAAVAAAQTMTPAGMPAGFVSAAPSGPPQTSVQNPLLGSVPAGTPTPAVLPLSLADAIHRGLQQNLQQFLSTDSQLAAKGQLGQARSPLLPNVSARVSENAAQIDLAAEGFGKIAGQFPGFPLIVGPFGYFDARAFITQSLVDLNAINTERSAQRNMAAAKFDYQDARELIVLAVGAAYLRTVASSARVDTAQAQVNTAQALYDQAQDRNRAGLAPGIDRLRAEVELQARQQQLISARNDLAKQRLALARAIGLPLGQQFTLTDTQSYEATAPVSLDEALNRAYANRADYQSAMAQVRAAEFARRAALSEHLPSLSVYGDYGAIGPTLDTLHGSFTAYAALRIPIFAGNRARADTLVADADLNRTRHLLENLRAQIEQDVRTALLDLQSASDQVNVARNNVDLAQQTLAQAQDRFNAGAADNIEVVQAQEAVAQANESYISSLYSYNLARIQLARATGSAERGIATNWKGQ